MKYSVITLIAVVILILTAGYYVSKVMMDGITYAEERRAVTECEKWIDWALVYPDFFLTQWQYAQCRTYGITIDAKIVNK